MSTYNILVCDDDKEIVNALEIYLKHDGYGVFKAYNGKEVLKMVEESNIHLIILDIMMPGLDGLMTTMKVRETYNIPIILLSAKSQDTDKIAGLNFGADDYVTKPYNPLELLARVKSQLRRYTQLGSMEQKPGLLKTGGLVLDDELKEIRVDGEIIKVTPTEYRIVKLLMENLGRVFPISDIYERVWNEPSFSVENTVAVHIRRIREKLEINPKDPKYLKVVWGVGYKIEKY
ncbi:MAG TPA: response regulator transcription factor [Clostridia bacterium]|nr:response regulator transcription factor [Clostridia bacterium]